MKVKARDFDKKFDEGTDISKHLDVKKARRPEQEQKRVNVDFPVWMIQLWTRRQNAWEFPVSRLLKFGWRSDLKRRRDHFDLSSERGAGFYYQAPL
jgi:hypothetical protein